MWTLYIITDTGREVPHWTAETRERCYEERRNLVAAARAHGSVIRTRVRKTR